MRQRLVRGVILPLYDRLSGRQLWAETQRLQALQWRSADELAERSLERLRALLRHAVGQVPWYGQLFAQAGLRPDDIRAIDDLARLPATSKADLRARFPDQVVAASLPPGRRKRMTTSGSTGLPLDFYGDRAGEDLWLGGYFLFLSWFGTGIWDTRVTVTSSGQASPNQPAPTRPLALARRVLLGERTVKFAGYDLTLDQFVTGIGKLKGERYFLRGYASYLTRLAAQIIEREIELPSYPIVAINHAETLTPLDSALIGQAFRCPVADQYSTWEVPQIAQTCPDNPAALHVNSERAIARVVRADGMPAPPGESGRVLLTDLGNYVMPLINYEIGDRAVAGKACTCGRGLPVLQSIDGRSREQILTPDGKMISTCGLCNFLTVMHPVLPYVWEFQAEQPALNELVLRIVPTTRFNQAFGRDLGQRLAEYLGGSVRVRVEAVERIELESSGKRLLIKSALTSDRPVAAQ